MRTALRAFSTLRLRSAPPDGFAVAADDVLAVGDDEVALAGAAADLIADTVPGLEPVVSSAARERCRGPVHRRADHCRSRRGAVSLPAPPKSESLPPRPLRTSGPAPPRSVLAPFVPAQLLAPRSCWPGGLRRRSCHDGRRADPERDRVVRCVLLPGGRLHRRGESVLPRLGDRRADGDVAGLGGTCGEEVEVAGEYAAAELTAARTASRQRAGQRQPGRNVHRHDDVRRQGVVRRRRAQDEGDAFCRPLPESG